jgi:membrane-associated phospholipid phosphatase
MATLAVWLPLQLAINHRITKISAHTGVASGCFTALVLFGKLGNALIVTGILLIVLIAWARLMTKNHTLLQVILGCVVGAGSVLLVFPFLLT